MSIYLAINISVSDSSSIFNKSKITKKFTHVFENEDDNYLILKSNHESFAILKYQSLIDEKEIMIFKIVMKNDEIKIVNCIDRCYNCTRKTKYYRQMIKDSNFYLWKSIPKLENYDFIDDKSAYLYMHQLKENDIIRLGTIKMIIREFHTFQNNQQNNQGNNNNCFDCNKKKYKRSFTLVLENDMEDICEFCNKKYLEPDNPLVKFCECEKYTHFKCMKAKFKEIMIQSTESNGCTRYYIKTHCFYCKKFIPWSFLMEDKKHNNEYKLYELIDIPRNQNEEYLLLETFDFYDTQKEFIKYIFYLKFRKQANNKNIETILIGGDRKKSNKYRYDKLVKIEKTNSISSQHALIDYDIEEKSLFLTNISDTHNTLVYQDEFKMKKNENNKLLLELGNIKIESKLIRSDELEDVKKNMENNPETFEERKQIEK
jgi:hypothetical protein